MPIIADVRSIDSTYMNATTRFGLAFRRGIALIDNERVLAEAVQLKGIQIIPAESFLERMPALLDSLGPFKAVQADIYLPEGYKLSQRKEGWQLLYKNKTLAQRNPIPDPEPQPIPALVLDGWDPPADEEP